MSNEDVGEVIIEACEGTKPCSNGKVKSEFKIINANKVVKDIKKIDLDEAFNNFLDDLHIDSMENGAKVLSYPEENCKACGGNPKRCDACITFASQDKFD